MRRTSWRNFYQPWRHYAVLAPQEFFFNYSTHPSGHLSDMRIERLQIFPCQILICFRKIGTLTETHVREPFSLHFLIQTAVDGVSNKPKRIFGMSPKG